MDWQFPARLLKLTRVNYGQKTILTSGHDSHSSWPWQRMFDSPIREHVQTLRGSHLQGICNIPSSDGLLRSRCSPADGDQASTTCSIVYCEASITPEEKTDMLQQLWTRFRVLQGLPRINSRSHFGKFRRTMPWRWARSCELLDVNRCCSN